MQQYNDPSYFYHEYQKYVDLVKGPYVEETSPATPTTAVSRSQSDVSEDRNFPDLSKGQSSAEGTVTTPVARTENEG